MTLQVGQPPSRRSVLDGAVVVSVSDVPRTSTPTPSTGDATRLSRIVTAGVTLSGHRAVIPSSGNNVAYADSANQSHMGLPLWLTDGAATAGSTLSVVLFGLITEPSWSWNQGPIYLGTNGQLTQLTPTVPTSIFLARLGYAVSASTVHFEPSPSIRLA